MLDLLISWIQEIPPVENSKSRFGNPAFRQFYDRLSNVRFIQLLYSIVS